MQNTPRENSLKSLVDLYTVVIGVALSLAVAGLFHAGAGLQSITLSSGVLFVGFVTTLLPFYHGALRHLDSAYLEKDTDKIRYGLLIIDFFLLFVHALVFVLLSQLLARPVDFAWVLITLLSLDVFWGVFAVFGASPRSSSGAEGKWTLINAVFVVIVGAYLLYFHINLAHAADPRTVAIVIAVACFFRSLTDYLWCKSFYFCFPESATKTKCLKR